MATAIRPDKRRRDRWIQAEAMTGRQVHRVVGRGSNRTVQLALDRLSSQGLLYVEPQGPSKLYSFNREHLAANAVLALVSLRSLLLERLRSELSGWRPAAAHASLFGSAARGDGDMESDIDLLVVRPDAVDVEDEAWRSQLDALRQAVPRWTGNHVSVSELSGDDVRQMLADEPPILAALSADAIDLAGPSWRTFTRAVL